MLRNILFGVLMIFGSLFFLFKISKSTSFQFVGDLVDHAEIQDRVIALTFDDGPSPGKTEEIIGILDKYKVRATFYLIGQSIEKNPQLARMLVDAGHEVGNHSFTHECMVFKRYGFISEEVERTNSLIRKSGFKDEITFRPPYGKKLFALPYYLKKSGIVSVTWDVAPDSELPISATPEEITDYALKNIRPGSIIMLHVMFESRKNSMAAVPKIILGLKMEGYKFVTVSELIEIGRADG
ncbi:polysaccharide deacetylase family protein [Microbulbifer sp. 2201CG32-9]|uniref:polysaccharide deacetylase family protein n=1 Tax=Microbulbifer sp. 2201CG32-9 TaxID=3232309 RepID=UPI00345BC6F8